MKILVDDVMKKGFILLVGLVIAIVMAQEGTSHLVANYTRGITLINNCPPTCNDTNPCTTDYCGEDTNYTCIHIPLNGRQPGCDEIDRELCIETSCSHGVCVIKNASLCCGNGLCEIHENPIECPDDCEEGQCYEVGESFDIMTEPNAECCPGLITANYEIPVEPIGAEDYCITPCYPDDCKICIKCDDICDRGENWCNCLEACPGDCLKPEEVSCVWNPECGFDQCSQERNICYEIKYACENGQCSHTIEEYENYSCALNYYPELTYPENAKCLDTCGDGICHLPEGHWWCPEDCPPCVEEGEQFNLLEYPTKKCCPGLTQIPASVYVDNQCIVPSCPCYVCTKCGDDVCSKGENRCNCPEDCAETIETICGNDICEQGESYTNCCIDCGCPTGERCEEGSCIIIKTSQEVAVEAHKIKRIKVNDSGIFVKAEDVILQALLSPDEAVNLTINQSIITKPIKVEIDKISEQKVVYKIVGEKNVKILWLIPATAIIEIYIDVSSGEVVKINKPWWYFLVFL